jgi:hypothetical protein
MAASPGRGRHAEIEEFRAAYREAVETVVSGNRPGPCFRLPASSDTLSLRGYLLACETLYVEAMGGAPLPAQVLDAGGSFGCLALALRELGIPGAAWEPELEGPFDLIVCLALQPLAPAPEEVAVAARTLVAPRGRVVLAVSNSRYWPVRLKELRRRPAAAPDGAVALGRPSYSERSLRALLRGSGLRPQVVRACNYSPRGLGGPKQQLASDLVMRLSPRHREALIARASPGEIG